MIGNVYSTQSKLRPPGRPSELFNAAVQVKAPLALSMNVIIEENDNYFLWTDLLATPGKRLRIIFSDVGVKLICRHSNVRN